MNTQPSRLTRIVTSPTEASVKMNGKPLGTTKSSGFMVLWQQGDTVLIEKTGFEPVKLHFTSGQPKKSITVTLRPIAASVPQPQPSPLPKSVSELPPVRAAKSRFTIRRVVLVTVVPCVVGIIVALIIVATHAPGPVSLPPTITPPVVPPVPPPAPPSPSARVLPPPTQPPRPTNLVLTTNPKMDKILDTVEYVLKFTNDERTQRGLPPLQSSAALAFIAQNHAENMCECRIVEQDNTVFPDGWRTLDERFRLVGLNSGAENISRERNREPKDSGKWLVKGWILNDNARTKMLDSAWHYMGIGICPCSDSGLYATQVFSGNPGEIR